MKFDRYDICNAFYLYATLHAGQDSKLFLERLEKINFHPHSLNDPSTLSNNAQQIYNKLRLKNSGQAIAKIKLKTIEV